MSGLYMPDVRFAAALKRQRDRIARGLEFVAADSDAIGDRWTHASWGLCSRDAEAWPDAEDHLWPDQFLERGRVAPKYLKGNQRCPMARKEGPNGCFHSCRIFKRREITRNKREEAVALYDAAIARLPAAALAAIDEQGE